MYINFWYVADQSQNITESPVKKKMLGQNFVLFRDTKGKVHCLSDVCVHRGTGKCSARQAWAPAVVVGDRRPSPATAAAITGQLRRIALRRPGLLDLAICRIPETLAVPDVHPPTGRTPAKWLFVAGCSRGLPETSAPDDTGHDSGWTRIGLPGRFA